MDVERGASAPPSPALPTFDPSGPVGRIPPPGSPGRGIPFGCAVRPMGPEDLPFVVVEHRAHFPDGFFARLGPRFLWAYTRTYVTSPHARAYVAEADGTPVGFLVGVTDPAAHRAHLIRIHGRGLALRACAALSVRPGLALHFLRTRLGRYIRKFFRNHQRAVPQSVMAPHDGVTAVLAHIVVTDRVRGLGLGKALVHRFVQDAADAGCMRASLVTSTGPDGAGPYYQRLGWHYSGQTRTPEGRTFSTYEYSLYTPVPDGSRPQGPTQ